MLPRTLNASQMRVINRSAILEYIRQNSPTSRTEIAEKLIVSLPTVMRVVEELFEDKLVQSINRTEKSGGRRRELLAYNKDACSVIGIDLGGTKLFGALANIGGEVLHEISIESHDTSGEASFEIVVSMIKDLVSSQVDGQEIRGIAVGAPGVTDNQAGVIEWAPSLNWRNYPLKEKLEQVFDLPVFIDNDVNLAVLGEHWFGVGKRTDNMMLISIGTGVGSGLILDGALYRGFTMASGEIGYMVPHIEDLGKNYQDSFGAMESLISGTGIAQNARQKITQSSLDLDNTQITSENVFRAAREGHAWAQETIQDTVNYLGQTIANINAILDLELVVISGGVARQADLLLQGINDQIKGVIPRVPRIEISTLGRSATVMGAIVMVIHATDDYYVIRKLS